MSSFNLSDIEKEFIGQKVEVTENPQTLRMGGTSHTFLNPSVNPECPVIKALRAKIGDTPLRIWLPESMGTCDWRPQRLNVSIDKDDKDAYRISGFRFG